MKRTVEDATRQIILVTPVWNDSARLARFGPVLGGALAGQDLPVHWVIADDGSTPEEKHRLAELLENFKEGYPDIRLMSSNHRSRKGGAVRMAWDAYPEADWVAFVDADGAVAATDLIRLIGKAVSSPSNASMVAIRRDSPTSSTLGASFVSTAPRCSARAPCRFTSASASSPDSAA